MQATRLPFTRAVTAPLRAHDGPLPADVGPCVMQANTLALARASKSLQVLNNCRYTRPIWSPFPPLACTVKHWRVMAQHHQVATPPSRPLVEVLDRVLAKGIVIAYDEQGLVAGMKVVEDAKMVTTEARTHTKMSAPSRAETESSGALLAAAKEFLRRLPSGHAPHVLG